MSGAGTFLLRVLFWLRVVMLIGSAGAMVGAFLMFWQGSLYLVHAWDTLLGNGVETHDVVPAGDGHGAPAAEAADPGIEHDVTQVTVQVLEAVDSFLFGVVLVIFAYSIAVGFVFRLPPRIAKSLPGWMKISGVGQLKQILAEVVIVVLIVIFARVVVESGGRFTWEMLVLPVSVALLAGAIWLLELGGEHSPPDSETADANGSSPPARPEQH